MSLKKLALLATALCALVAFAAPASASAAHEFTAETETIEGSESVTLNGELGFGNIFGSYTCEVSSAVNVSAADAEATSFVINTEECVGTGTLAGCVLVEDSTTVGGEPIGVGNPATITITAGTDLTVDGPLAVHNTFAECDIEELTLTFDSLLGEPVIEGGYVNGLDVDDENSENEGLTDLGAFELATVAGGSLSVAPQNTISID